MRNEGFFASVTVTVTSYSAAQLQPPGPLDHRALPPEFRSRPEMRPAPVPRLTPVPIMGVRGMERVSYSESL